MTGPIAPTPITADRTENWLRRLFAAKGQSLSGIEPRVQIGLDAGQGKYAEELIAAGKFPFFVRVALGASVGNVPTYGLFNPGGSQLIAVVERAIIDDITSSTFGPTWAYARVSGPPAGASETSAFASDLRTKDDTSALTTRLGIILHSANTAAGFASWATYSGGAAMYGPSNEPAVAGARRVSEYPAPVVIGPGSAFGVFGGAGMANTPSTFHAYGYLRAALPGELVTGFGL